jgi:esterase/lipase
VINLTIQEQQKVAAYLNQEAETLMGIIKQMESINTPDFVVAAKRKEIVAMLIVARIFNTTEEMSL